MLLQGWGLDPVGYPSATALHPRAAYLSGADDLRARDLEDAWCDPDVAGIFCLRGGYGTVRVLDLLDEERMRAAGPTPLFGSSDVTALHEWLRERLGTPTWFTPMIGTGSLLDDDVAVGSLRSAVFEPAGGRRVTRRRRRGPRGGHRPRHPYRRQPVGARDDPRSAATAWSTTPAPSSCSRTSPRASTGSTAT